ncbi:MAG TPA: STAS domain-containing protein [Terracidiphilus sp.]|nr:STAS domain-containing protein [Terracidiphilus sp.]
MILKYSDETGCIQQRGNELTSGMVSATDLQVSMEESNERTVVRLRGRLSIDSSPAFRDQLLSVLLRASARAVLVDLTDVAYIDASGIATLVEALKIARNRRNNLCLVGLQGRVLHLFEVTGLLDLFGTNGSRSASTALKVS